MALDADLIFVAHRILEDPLAGYPVNALDVLPILRDNDIPD